MIKKIILGIGAIIVIAGIAINVAKSYLKPASATETPITTSQPTQTISLIDTLSQLNASNAKLQQDIASMKETDSVNNDLLQQILNILQAQQAQINALAKK